MYQPHSPEVFQRYFKKDTKAWFSPVRLIYSQLLLHNIISNHTSVSAHFYRTANNLFNFCAIINDNKKETFCF